MVLPACVADKVHVPAFNIVIVNVDTVQTALVVDDNDTVRPDDAVEAMVNVLADHGRSAGAVKEIV